MSMDAPGPSLHGGGSAHAVVTHSRGAAGAHAVGSSAGHAAAKHAAAPAAAHAAGHTAVVPPVAHTSLVQEIQNFAYNWQPVLTALFFLAIIFVLCLRLNVMPRVE